MTAALNDTSLTSDAIGKRGALVVRSVVEGGQTRLQPVFRRIPYQWHGAHYQNHDDQPFLLIQNSGGGFVEGDSGLFHLRMEPGTRVLVTTTEATKFYRSDSGESAVETYRFDCGSGCLLEFIPDEVIPYAGSHAIRDTRFSLAKTSRLFAAEVTVAGRVHFRHDELFGFSSLRSRLQVDVDGTPRYLDNLIAAGSDIPMIARAWAGHSALGTVVVYSQGDNLDTSLIWDALAEDPAVHVGASSREGVLVVRILGPEVWHVHNAIFEVWRVVRPFLAGKAARPIVKC